MTAGICILAGGLSRRMGRDKRRMRLASRTLLGHVRHTVESSSCSDVRVIRKDLVPRCGPLGGVYTALKTSPHHAELFLSCDMPFVTSTLMRHIIKRKLPAFVEHDGCVGFPFILRVADLAVVEQEIRAGRFSLQNLAKRLKAKRVRLGGLQARQLFNVNTPADWQEARSRVSELPLSTMERASIVQPC
jgi:molybdopterin-guanine dinucleotide biosynthesis protein A